MLRCSSTFTAAADADPELSTAEKALETEAARAWVDAAVGVMPSEESEVMLAKEAISCASSSSAVVVPSLPSLRNLVM